MIVDGSPVHYASTVVHVLYSTRIGGPGAVSGWTVGGGGVHLLWHTGVETRIELCSAIRGLSKSTPITGGVVVAAVIGGVHPRDGRLFCIL